MSNCPDCRGNANAGSDHVPNFAVTGFDSVPATQKMPLADNVQALQVKACVSASYNPGTNQICFDLPYFGQHCINSPVSIPVGGQLSACAQTCGSIIPTGAKVTISLNGNPIYSYTLFGSC